MRRKIPSTAAAAAFESSARHQSFTRAAGEISVTQSAVCRQVAGLHSRNTHVAFGSLRFTRLSPVYIVTAAVSWHLGRKAPCNFCS